MIATVTHVGSMFLSATAYVLPLGMKVTWVIMLCQVSFGTQPITLSV